MVTHPHPPSGIYDESKVDHGQVVKVGLLETPKATAKPIHPSMACLRHPSAGTVTGIGAFSQAIFAAGTNLESELVESAVGR